MNLSQIVHHYLSSHPNPRKVGNDSNPMQMRGQASEKRRTTTTMTPTPTLTTKPLTTPPVVMTCLGSWAEQHEGEGKVERLRLLHHEEKVERGEERGKPGTSLLLGAFCPLACPLLTLLIIPPLFHRKTHAERAVEDDAEDAKGIPKKLTP
jgi:hypothetical protein